MDFRKTSIKDLNKMIIDKEISISKLVSNSVNEMNKHLDSNFVVTPCNKEALEHAKELDKKIEQAKKDILFGIPYLLKDSICTEDILTTGGSKILSSYYPPYSAKVYKDLNVANSIMIGKSTLDELGMGATGLTGFNGEVYNPLDKTRIPGGSSSGSVFGVAAGVVPFAIGTDTGDSIRKPAGFCGVVGYKPTYGSISRYGVIPYSPSLDHVGVFTNNVEDCFLVSQKIFNKDLNDVTSIDNKLSKSIDKKSKYKFGYLNFWLNSIDEKQKNEYKKLFDELKKEGHEIIEVKIDNDILESLLSLYRVISFSEVTSTHANLDGIKFGVREKGETYQEIIKKTRSKNLGEVVKARYAIGEFMLHAENQNDFLLKAKMIRRKLINQINELFKKCDILLTPANNEIAPKIKDIKAVKHSPFVNNVDDLLLIANFTGIPSMTLPFIKKNNMPLGLNINAKYKCDNELFSAALSVEKIINSKFKGVNHE